jgi:hypothetical protein
MTFEAVALVGIELDAIELVATLGRGRDRAAVFSVWIISWRESSMCCFRPSLGLASTATAPALNASSATLLPSVESVEQITVGMGVPDMI